jgi:hypothetical protein
MLPTAQPREGSDCPQMTERKRPDGSLPPGAIAGDKRRRGHPEPWPGVLVAPGGITRRVRAARIAGGQAVDRGKASMMASWIDPRLAVLERAQRQAEPYAAATRTELIALVGTLADAGDIDLAERVLDIVAATSGEVSRQAAREGDGVYRQVLAHTGILRGLFIRWFAQAEDEAKDKRRGAPH